MPERTIKNAILRTSRGFPALLLTGPRQVGKTWLLKEIKTTGRKYISLDDIQARNLAKRDPRLFIQTYTPPV
ncbi:MAG: AAA family ATPase, partial [Treponema sp.]|nr:AAA family ATPase [Treponema sp.]